MIQATDPVAPVDPSPAPKRDVAQLAPIPSPAPSAPVSDVRLSIDRAPSGDFFVYTFTDQATGQVIVQLPSDHVAGLKNQPDYMAGALLKTTA